MGYWPKFSFFEKKFRHVAIYRQQKKGCMLLRGAHTTVVGLRGPWTNFPC
jgi:hypothetical protein